MKKSKKVFEVVLEGKTDEQLAEMSSTELEELSANLTSLKDQLMSDYASTQQRIQRHIGPAQQRELAERNKDPEHAAKHQGVGFGQRR